MIAIDILGFGQSPAPADSEYTLEDHVDSLDATIRSLNLREPFTLVGHSLGSLIVSRLAAVELSRGIAGCAGCVRRDPRTSSWSARRSTSSVGHRRFRVRARVDAYLRAYDFLRANKEFTLETPGSSRGCCPRDLRGHGRELDAVRQIARALHRVADPGQRHRSLPVPVDVVYGSLDAFIAPGSMTVIERMRHVTMHRVEANDHIIRKRLARVVARVIDPEAEPVTAGRLVRSRRRRSDRRGPGPSVDRPGARRPGDSLGWGHGATHRSAAPAAPSR